MIIGRGLKIFSRAGALYATSSVVVCCWVWNQVTKCHLSNSRAPEFTATINPLIWRISCNLDSLTTNPLQGLLIGLCHLEFYGSDVSFTLWVLLLEMLSSAVLEILESDVIFMTASAVNAGVAPKPNSPRYLSSHGSTVQVPV